MGAVGSVSGEGGFEAGVWAWGWGGRPRVGIALIAGQPYYFDCPFSDALDDSPDEYRLWLVPEARLDDELTLWRMFTEWRSRFDSGDGPPPLEKDATFSALSGRLRAGQEPPAEA